MARSGKKKFFTKHAKSSAVLVSVGIHVLVLLAAVSFVAVSYVNRDEATFEVAEVKRPKVKLRKLTVPVKSKKSRPKPKLRKQIVVPKPVKTSVIKMPEMVGVAGGTGYLDGAGGLGGLGLGLDINFFGIMGGGDHIVFVIDYSYSMRGEKEKIMRREAARVIEELPPKTEFGVIFFAGPAWPASSGLERYVKDWVRTERKFDSFRPRDWSDMPRVRYKTASSGSRSSMINTIQRTPLVYGTVFDNPLYMALSMDPIPDTIFFMTDGSCSQKRGIDSFRIMVDQLKAAGKKVPKVHTVGFGVKSNKQLRQIAELTGGESNFLQTKDYLDKYGPGKDKSKSLKPKFDISGIKSVGENEYPVLFDLATDAK